MSELTIRRVLKLGDRGYDVRAMKRGLARAGHGRLVASANPVLGPFAVRHLRDFQHGQALEPDGVYGKDTHGKLIQFFDKFARELYEKKGNWEPKDPTTPATGSLHLQKDFVVTHETAGLPGFPAMDAFAEPNTPVLAPEDGVVDRLSGRDPKLGGTPGGPYGWSIYLRSPSGQHYMTHFATRDVTVGQQITQGESIGTVCDSALSGKPGTSHIHHGKKRE